MLAFKTLLIVAACLGDALASPMQVAFKAPNTKPRQLHGRFLQITDIHPDPYYAPDTAERTGCHRKKSKKMNNTSGYYGTPFSDYCDAPLRLTNFTLDFLDEKWASEIDFVVWTGDNARHDNDPKLPRTTEEIYDLNRAVAAKMDKVFASKGIPVVPSLGNNDVWPHNIMTPGPNGITYEFSRIWETFIPFPYLQVFQRGAYYSKEVIPDEVAVISLNTMYFYDSNKAVGGCGFYDQNDPGNLQFDWLEVQLKYFRYRKMQVYITGHVPPSPGNYFPDCYVRYAELSLRFQDTILGHLFGHMNADHFFFLEAIDLEFTDEPEPRGEYTPLYDTLLNEFAALPTKAKELNYDEYAVVNTAPPVVPNPYLPSFRIFSYNITGPMKETGGEPGASGKKRRHGHRRGDRKDKEAHCRHKEYRETWKCYLNETWNSDPNSPSRKNTRWTPLGYAQYYMPGLEDANKKAKPRFKLEYMTFAPEQLHPPKASIGSGEQFHYPIPLERLPKSLRESGVKESKYAPYKMADLTVVSWVGLGQKLGDKGEIKLRKRFRKYMYMGGEAAV